MTNSTLFDTLIKGAEKLPDSRYAIGGNAPVMAMRLFHEGCDVTLASTLTPKHLKNIPSGIKGIYFNMAYIFINKGYFFPQ